MKKLISIRSCYFSFYYYYSRTVTSTQQVCVKRYVYGSDNEHFFARCDILDVVVEIDRILRPNGYLVVHDSMEILNKLTPILRSLHWSVSLHQDQFLVGRKGFWRPTSSSD